MCMDSLLHAADISNPIKPFDIVQMWTDKVLAEFWQQVIFIKNQENNEISFFL